MKLHFEFEDQWGDCDIVDFGGRLQMMLQDFSAACYSAQRTYWQRVWPFRLGRYAPARIARKLCQGPLWTELRPGVKMLLDPSDLISRVLLETGEWDPTTWTAIAGHLASEGTFVDVGAHMGHCSLLAATIVGPRGRVIAIEANPETATLLRRNIAASTVLVEVLPIACSESESFVDLWAASHGNSGSSSISKTNASLAGPAQNSYRVASRTLDSVLNDLGISQVDVLKIDVEGAEMAVLRGASETLSGCRPILMIELDDQLLATMGASSNEVHRFLASFGYRPTGQFDDANVLFTS